MLQECCCAEHEKPVVLHCPHAHLIYVLEVQLLLLVAVEAVSKGKQGCFFWVAGAVLAVSMLGFELDLHDLRGLPAFLVFGAVVPPLKPQTKGLAHCVQLSAVGFPAVGFPSGA